MDLPPVDPQWWRTLFDEVYLQTDARSVQDRDATRREVDALVRALALQPGEAVLDLCGGHGRHALELTRRGYGPVTVLDYSQPLLCRGLAQAREEGLAVAFIRGDARQVPLARDSFQAVALLANSFGYGATGQDDLEILKESRRLLRQGGRLWLETADPQFVRGLVRDATYRLRLYDPEALRSCLQEAGFSRVRVAAQPAASGAAAERGSLSRRLAAVAAI